MDHTGLHNALAYLAAGVIAVPIFRKLGLGSILGYLAAGAIIGPQGLHLIEHPEEAMHLAEFGVVMLLFIIGLELKPEKLWDMRVQIGVLGVGQLIISALLIAAVVYSIFTATWQVTLLIGLTLGLSSTAFAVQLMDEHGIMGGALGRKGFAILLLQDMAVIPILLLVSAWAPSAVGDDIKHALPWWAGPIAVIAVLLVGRFLVNPLLKLVAQSGSREILTAAALLIVMGAAILMLSVELSMGMGAFLAGIILANSSFRHQLEADIEPFKGLLLGLFFIAVGMTLDLALFVSKPLIILALAFALMAIKTLVVMVLVRVRQCNWKEGILLGLMLSQGGEFAFVVMTKAVGLSLVDQSLASHLVLVVGISMALTAPMVMLFKWYLKHVAASAKDQGREYDTAIDGEPEVVVAGFGRFGQIVGRILAANNIHFTALDKDAKHVDFVKKFGNKIFFGDALRMDLLEAAGLNHARILVVAGSNSEQSID
ncbi:MAG: monovalent cation:proton antiporter-2 (CPA2) family protein, partial [Lentisphaeria bacterium]